MKKIQCPGCGLELQSGELVDVRNCGIFGECADCPACGRRLVRNLLWRCLHRTGQRKDKTMVLVGVRIPDTLGLIGNCPRSQKLVVCDELWCCTRRTEPRCRAEAA